MEFKSFGYEFKASKKDLEFEGYASIFGNIDAYNDRMLKGAFAKTIQENIKRIKILSQHEYTNVIGRPTVLSEDSKGLYFEGKLSDTMLGRDMFTLIKDKAIDEMSIGYNAIKWDVEEVDENIIRNLKEVRLWELSPVTWGANEKANIKGLYGGLNNDIMSKEVKRLEALIQEIKAELLTLKPNKPQDVNDNDIQTIMNTINKYK